MVRLIKGDKELSCSPEEAEEHITYGGWKLVQTGVKKKETPTSSAPPMLKAFIESMRSGK